MVREDLISGSPQKRSHSLLSGPYLWTFFADSGARRHTPLLCEQVWSRERWSLLHHCLPSSSFPSPISVAIRSRSFSLTG